MIIDHAANAISFKAYQCVMRCWRCWQQYSYFVPNEFEDVTVLFCDTCGASRASEDYGPDGIGYAKKKFLDVHYPTLKGWGGRKPEREFARVFEDSWSHRCSCGGRFRIDGVPKCSRCRARQWRWLEHVGNETVMSPPIPLLGYTIPPEYANAPARPPLESVPGTKGTR